MNVLVALWMRLLCLIRGHDYFKWPKREAIDIDRHGTQIRIRTLECRHCGRIELEEV